MNFTSPYNKAQKGSGQNLTGRTAGAGLACYTSISVSSPNRRQYKREICIRHTKIMLDSSLAPRGGRRDTSSIDAININKALVEG